MLFEVWAPHAETVTLHIAPGRTHAMAHSPTHQGWWQTEAAAGDGSRYGFAPDGGPALPDPRSRRQPDGPEGLSAVVDHDAYTWRHPWRGLPLPGAVLYELHVGTFTREGTFEAAAERLGHLAGLGVTHVELMPVCPFPGTHGWGYDGVALWAVHEPYGGPEGLKRFVDAAHGQGLGVVLDVVHNHLGPSGNQLPAFGPYFTERHQTPWGAAVNLDAPGSDEVRSYLIGSALAFLRDYQLDGLRLDAVHALADTRAQHFLAELSEAVDTLAAHTGRPLFLIAESDLNDPRTTAPRSVNGHGLHAQWNDDFHHALHTALTGESHGYYADFAHAPLTALAKTLTGAFFHDGGHSTFRGRRHGRPVLRPGAAGVPAYRFLAYAQTHDQIGNRALGERLAALATPGALACAAALVLLAPGTPQLFMGEEWGARTPWQYFTDHQDPELAEAVRQGRRREFAAHGWPTESVPDPQDPATRARSCLEWSEPEQAPHDRLLDWHRTLIRLRHAHPVLAHLPLGEARVEHPGPAVEAETERWLLLRNGPLHVAANLSPDRGAHIRLPSPHPVLLASWDAEARLADGTLSLPPESAAVLG
ncbi:malto-oligosyltrehalose trehalohydrolase [Streptomyces sp. NBC_01775]|uniref:malto-oligosyltrehalose trehalohydrolase n=1 Tax=Streptomyces sp. NBC_01775 TaxID=2975939 RepID=UPI002DDAEA93|nr:malto-oligosyltrehalose trehalohydrolase [Streptomyces sp. NBC_01775]WSB76151.1 malto-oligosyltrehalose trehalohydrolase [Streptomyces sp. NBC_01775]